MSISVLTHNFLDANTPTSMFYITGSGAWWLNCIIVSYVNFCMFEVAQPVDRKLIELGIWIGFLKICCTLHDQACLYIIFFETRSLYSYMEQFNVFAGVILLVVGNYFYNTKIRLIAIHTLIVLILCPWYSFLFKKMYLWESM